MKFRPLLLLPAALALSLPALAAGQTGVSPAARDNRNGNIILSDPQANANNVKPDGALPPEVRDRIARFERARENYLREQAELNRALRAANTERERERIREQIRARLEAWREALKKSREELKDRLPDLRRRLPELNEVLDNARNNARDAVNTTRKRRE